VYFPCCYCVGTRRDNEDVITALRFWPFYVIIILCLHVYILTCFVAIGIFCILTVVYKVPSILLHCDDGLDDKNGNQSRWCTGWTVQLEIAKFCGKQRLLAGWLSSPEDVL
jgi:hypothetical protein